MKTLILAAIRCSLIFTAVAALSLAYPASVQAVPTTYQYTGNPFTIVEGPYTTSMFVTAMVTLANPLPPNFSGLVTPTAFTFSDGVQTITNLTATTSFFAFETDAAGMIFRWDAEVFTGDIPPPFITNVISTATEDGDVAEDIGSILDVGFGLNQEARGTWTMAPVPDAGSSLALLSLSLTALGVAARQFKRAAA